MEAKRQRLLSMTYNEIRSLCRQRGMKATGTKAKLVETLSETMMLDIDNEQMDVEEQKENLNGTFTMEEDEISVIPKEQLKKAAEVEKAADITLDESIVAGSFITPDNSPSVKRVEKKPVEKMNNNVTTRCSARNTSKAAPSRLPKPGHLSAATSGKGRFASSHTKAFSKMASIEDHQKKLETKHEQHVKSVSETINRLATPKSQREKVRKFPPPGTPNKENFKFGTTKPEDIEKVQRPYDKEKAASSRVTRSSKQGREPQADVKKITMAKKRTLKATIPDCSERIEQLATPKSAGPVPIPKERKMYTPKTTPYKYVDTTKMSDAELRAFDARQKRLDARSRRLNFQ